jgi:hypothetical protein
MFISPSALPIPENMAQADREKSGKPTGCGAQMFPRKAFSLSAVSLTFNRTSRRLL